MPPSQLRLLAPNLRPLIVTGPEDITSANSHYRKLAGSQFSLALAQPWQLAFPEAWPSKLSRITPEDS
jgi:hypothetical protein